MTENSTKQRIATILADDSMGREEQIKRLKEMYSNARAIQRAATEGPMNDDDGQNDDLSEIERALLKFGVEPTSPEGTGAATL